MLTRSLNNTRVSRQIISPPPTPPGGLVLQAVAGLEYPADHREAGDEEAGRHAEAQVNVYIGPSVKAPAKPADQIHDGIEQAEGAPGRRQHIDRIECAAEEGERRHHERGDELQLLPAFGPEAEYEAE